MIASLLGPSAAPIAAAPVGPPQLQSTTILKDFDLGPLGEAPGLCAFDAVPAANGTFAYAYVSGKVVYFNWETGSSPKKISGTTAECSVALRFKPDGSAVVAWIDVRNQGSASDGSWTNLDIYVAGETANWTEELVTSFTDGRVMAFRMEIDLAARVVFAYERFTIAPHPYLPAIFVARSPNWTEEAVSNGVDAQSVDLALDSQSRAHVVWHYWGDLETVWYANETSSWTNVRVDQDQSPNYWDDRRTPTVAIDSADQAHVVWEDWRDSDPIANNYRGEIWHASTADGFVNTELVLPDASANYREPRASIDATGLLHVAWHQWDNSGYVLLYANGTDWNIGVQLTNLTLPGFSLPQFSADPVSVVGSLPIVLYFDARTGVETIWKSTAWDFAPDTTPPEIGPLPDRTAGISRGIDLVARGAWDNDRIVSYDWTFSGPATFVRSGYEVLATFTTAGIYQVNLYVLDPAGLSASRDFSLDVRPEPSTVGWKSDRALYPISRAYGYLELHPWTGAFPITFFGDGTYSRQGIAGETVFGPVRLTSAPRESAVFDDQGNLHTVGFGPGNELWYTKDAPNGANLVPSKLLPLGGLLPYQPYLASAAGKVWLTWMDQRDGNFETYLAALDLTGNLAWGPVRLSHDPRDSQQPILTVVADRLWTVWWDGRDGSAAFASVLNLSSLSFVFSEVRISDGIPWDVAPSPDGGVVIAAGIGNTEVAIVRVTQNGTSSATIPVSFQDGLFSWFANLDVDAQGDAQVGWWEGGNGSELRFATVSPAGAVDPVGGLLLRKGTGDDLPQVTVRIGPDGEPRVAYTDGSAGTGATMYFADRDRKPPVAVITARSNAGPLVPVTFDGSQSTDNRAVVGYAWDFGDGGTGSGAIVQHSFNASGDYLVTLAVMDDHGNGNATNMTITIVPQTLMANFNVSPTLGNRSTPFLVDASASRDVADPNATVEVRWDWEGDDTWDTPWSVDKMAEHTYEIPGSFLLTLEVRTSAGLMNLTRRAVTVDGVGPETTAFPAGSLGDNGWYVGPVTIDLTATDDASGVASSAYSVDGGTWQPYADPFLLTADGVHILQFYSTDRVGNVEPFRTETIRIDSVAPQTTAQMSGTGGLAGWFTSSVVVTLSATDSTSGVSGVSARIDGGSWQSAMAPFSVQGDRIHQVEYRATDLAGNLETIRFMELRIDATAPTTASEIAGIEGTGGWFTSDVVVALEATDQGSGVFVIRYRIDGGSWLAYEDPFSVSDGTHAIDYQSTDAAGNGESVQSITVRVDQAAPALVINPMPDILSNSRVTIKWNATDATSGIARSEVSLDGGPFESVDFATEYSFLVADGDHTVIVWTIDAAGNSAQQTVRFRTDTNVFSFSGPYRGAPTVGGIIALVVVGLFLIRRFRPKKPARLEEMTPLPAESVEER